MRLIVGLGNPGEKYAKTRHNAGWLALDAFRPAARWQEEKRFSALICKENETVFAKPLTFMNDSGRSVQKILSYYQLLPKSLGIVRKKDADLKDVLLVIHDDLDIPFGQFKLSAGSGSAGHRGVESIISHLKTKNFLRLRLGIGNEKLRQIIPADKFVLQPFDREEQAALPEIFRQIDLLNLK